MCCRPYFEETDKEFQDRAPPNSSSQWQSTPTSSVNLHKEAGLAQRGLMGSLSGAPQSLGSFHTTVQLGLEDELTDVHLERPLRPFLCFNPAVGKPYR
jgi:hypothetical protein